MSRWARWRYFAWTLLAYALWAGCFELVGNVAARLPTHDLRTSWDSRIPLVPAAIWPYEACYLLPFVIPLVARDAQRVRVGLVAAVVANLAAFFVYLAYPVAFPRPSLGSSLSERVLALEYALDFQPGANNLPSLHVAMSWLILITCHRQGLSRAAFCALTLLTLAITASTLLVKQHLVYDAIVGVVWAFGSFALAQSLHRAWTSKRAALIRPDLEAGAHFHKQ
ncbi:MAG TPA: phosphatase PAP2 family protein [Polyangiaceae bacterium]|nr:phosphatase PAP2 family protein [Polyangiaceae bacterium]